MDEFPKIAYIREKLSHLPDDEIREAELQFWELCMLVKEVWEEKNNKKLF